ncbi:hypothetical protein GCM10010211_01850 [Streptomyces albospinus]|uniref:Uncharacterized protein n=1 Tax=Streptomyces albospinus TaxID=285515 RepID=A0ABQ2UKG1_9ACTN|nr:hypothetical protein [Streptomyces albospinus]GGU42339.1 hypothetical protein GCM10010211_01850 [Streptomyces albospinus]
MRSTSIRAANALRAYVNDHGKGNPGTYSSGPGDSAPDDPFDRGGTAVVFAGAVQHLTLGRRTGRLRAGRGPGDALFVSTSPVVITRAAAGVGAAAILLHESALGPGMACGPRSRRPGTRPRTA